MMAILFRLILILLFLHIAGCKVNPFAPKSDFTPRGGIGLGDQRSIDGFYKNFQFAYITRDTTVYGQLLGENFTFVYRDYDNNVDVNWNRDIEMVTTLGLFRSSELIDLQWGGFLLQEVDSASAQADLIRSFRLRITLGANDVVEVNGNASFTLRRNNAGEAWRAIRWRDESGF